MESEKQLQGASSEWAWQPGELWLPLRVLEVLFQNAPSLPLPAALLCCSLEWAGGGHNLDDELGPGAGGCERAQCPVSALLWAVLRPQALCHRTSMLADQPLESHRGSPSLAVLFRHQLPAVPSLAPTVQGRGLAWDEF